MIIYYDHKRRQCFREDSGNHSIPIELDEVKKLWNELKIDDSNIALHTLANNDWDTDAVERYYIEAENY